MVKYKLTVDEPWGFNHNGSNILHGIVIKQLSPTFLLFKSDSFLDFNGQKSCIQLEKNDVIDCGLDNRFVILAYSQKLKIK